MEERPQTQTNGVDFIEYWKVIRALEENGWRREYVNVHVDSIQ